MALPMALIIIATGSVDLSVANNLLMSAVVMAKLFEAGVPMGIAVSGGILAGTIGGLLMEFLWVWLDYHPLSQLWGHSRFLKGSDILC